MIDEEATLREHGNIVSDLSRGSQKLVVRVCDGCGDIKTVSMVQATSLCWGCSMKTPERRTKISEALTGRPCSSETRKKIGDAQTGDKHRMYGKHRAPESIQKMVESNTGRKRSPETRARMSEAQKGKVIGADGRRNMSEAQKGKTLSEEAKRKVSMALTGRPCSLDTRRKIANGNRGKVISDAARHKQSATWQGIPCDEWEEFATDSPYCPKFDEACRESNREKYDRCCFLSSATEVENGAKLSVHHVDMNKAQGCDGHAWKLVPLSKKWHAKSHAQVWVSRIQYLLNNVYGGV